MTNSSSKRSIKSLTATILIGVLTTSTSLIAQSPEYLVSTSDLQKAAVDASQKRLQDRETLRSFLSTETAQRALKSANMSPTKVEDSVAALSDDELAQLAARATKAQTDFAAGSLSNRDLLLIIVGVAALILIIVAVR